MGIKEDGGKAKRTSEAAVMKVNRLRHVNEDA